MTKTRLDVLLTTRQLAPSRERARTMIMEGCVFVNGQREDKPGTAFDPDKIRSLEVKGDTLPFVSRGGYKLEKAVKLWQLSFDNLVCLDIGASTGGFTDVMLQYGAAKVYAVDSGTNQLAYSLRRDERVISMERTNFRYVTDADIPEQIDFAAADVSFISLTKIFPPAYALLRDRAHMVCLVKPQFEAGREHVGKKGVVRDPAVHRNVLERVMLDAEKNGFSRTALSFSPVRGPEGNIEYLLLLQKQTGGGKAPVSGTGDTGTGSLHDAASLSARIVREAHDFFSRENTESGTV